MSTAAVEDPPTPRGLLDVWRELDLPEGWRAEIIRDRSITVTPPPSIAHNLIAGWLNRLLVRNLPDDLGVYQTLGIRVPLTDKLYIPDLVVLPEASLTPGGPPEVAAEHALLTVEITSKDNADNDRTFKRRGYAHGPVPLYLLIDSWGRPGPSVTLFSEPENGDYRRDVRVPFGEKISLPEPFTLDIDTSGFPSGQ